MSETSVSVTNKPRKQRPLSPHLQIYKPQLTTILSISHRVSGILLTLGLVLFTGWIVTLAGPQDSFDAFQAFLGSIGGQILLFGCLSALCFHTATGVRHLFWDAGVGYSIPATYRSGYAVLGFSVLATAVVWILGMNWLS